MLRKRFSGSLGSAPRRPAPSPVGGQEMPAWDRAQTALRSSMNVKRRELPPIHASAAATALAVGALALDGVATPEQISLVLPVTGSLTQSATATCRYRITVIGTWFTGHPLYRTRPSLNPTPDFGGAISDVFAWPILGLTPGNTYDVEVTVSDGVTSEIKNLTTTTRSLPASSGSTTVSVAAGSTAAQIAAAINGAAAGAVIQIEGNCNITSAISITAGGTLAQPKYVRGATRGTTIARTDAAGSVISLTGAIGHIVFENMTLTGNGTDAVPPTINALVSSDTALKTNVTFRRITATGINRGFHITNGQGCLYYDCTLTGNNLWQTSPIDFLTTNRTWNDDGIMLAGNGNCAFNCTLKGFGDTIAYASHAEGDITAINCHAWELDIRNSCDDSNEMDYARRNVTFYKNRVTNCMSCMSIDPSQGGPLICARNIYINAAAYTIFKWNDGGAGWFVYNNTIAATVYNLRAPNFTDAFWVKHNDDDVGVIGINDSYAVRNNIFVMPAGLGDNIIVNSSGHDNMDWTHNSYNRDFGIQFDGGSWATLAAAQAGISNRTAVIGSLYSPNNRPFAQDNICATQPFDTPATLGATSSVEVTATYTPSVASGTAAVKNAGVVIPNFTDGFSGAAPDRGAIISGQAIPLYGDQSGTPEYVAALAPFQVKALNTTTSGRATMVSATPAEWQTGQPGVGPGGLEAVILEWSGGAKFISGTEMIVHGGGHNNGNNNGIYRYDFAGTTAPFGYKTTVISPVSAINTNAPADDGKPNSVHTYDLMGHMPGTDYVYRHSGSQWDLGGGAAGCWRYNLVTETWTSLGDHPGRSGDWNRGVSFFDPTTKKIFFIYTGCDFGFFYRTPDAASLQNTWDSSTAIGFQIQSGEQGEDSIGVRGPGNESILVGEQNHRVFTFNWSSETVSTVDMGATGDTGIFNIMGISAVYDPLLDCYWAWGGRQSTSPGWANIYRITRGTWVVQAFPLFGDTISVMPGMVGSYGRFLFNSDWRMIGVVTDVDTPAYVIRLPSS